MTSTVTNLSAAFRRRMHLAALGIVCLQFVVPRALALEDDDDQEEPPAREQEARGLESVGESVFGARGPQALKDFRSRLDRILNRKLESARRLWRLSDTEIRKVELAGRGDIRRLFAEIEEHRRDLNTAKQGVNAVFDDNPLNHRTSALRSKLRSGPFEEDSLFSKSLKAMLSPEQAAQYERHRAAAARSKQRISPDNVADLLRADTLKKHVYRLVWNHDGSQLALVEHRKNVEIYSFPEARLLRALLEGRNPVAFDFAHNGNLVAFGTQTKVAAIVDLAGDTEIRLETDNFHPAVSFNPGGATLATGGYGTKARLWSVSSGAEIREFAGDGVEGALTPVFSPDGTLLAIGNRNSATHVFEVATGRLLHRLPKTMSHGLSFDPSGKALAVTYVDGSLVLWDVSTGDQRRQVQALANELYTVDWSPDGRLLATGGYNTPVTLWNSEDLSILNELETPEWVFSIAFSPDGTRLAFAGSPRVRTDEKLVELWAVP